MVGQSSATNSQSKITDYCIGNQLGEGAYAVVKQGFHKSTGRKVAIKIYEKYKISGGHRKSSVDREIRLLKTLSHENIVKLYETIDTPKQLYLIQELVRGKSLSTYLRTRQGRKLEEAEGVRIFRQVLAGIVYCHQNNVTHRDLKMENLLLDEQRNVKIIDFGFSICAPSSQKLKVFCGTPSYMAPEIVNKKEYFGPPTDVWSLGILLFAMLCGSFPFRGVGDRELFHNISNGHVPFPAFVSAKAKLLIAKMLAVDPLQRITAPEVRSHLSIHSFRPLSIPSSSTIPRLLPILKPQF